MDLQTLRNRVQLEVRRAGGELPMPAVVDYYLNRGGEEFARATRCVRTSVSVNEVASTTSYTHTALEVLRAYHDGNPLVLTSYTELDVSVGKGWRTRTGTPLYYLLPDASTIRLYPAPSANLLSGLVLDVVADFTALSGETDVPTIPTKHHQALVWFAADQLRPTDEFKAKWQAEIDACTEEVERAHSSELRVVPYRQL